MTLKKFITIVSLYSVALIICIFCLKPFANMLKTPVDINTVSDWSTFKSGTRVKGDITIVYDCYFRKTAGNYVAGTIEAQDKDSVRGYFITNGNFTEDNTQYEITQYLTYTSPKKYYKTLDAMTAEMRAWEKESAIEPVSYDGFLTTTFHVDGYLVKISGKEKESAISYLNLAGMATYDAEKALVPYKIKQVQIWIPATFLGIALLCIVAATLLLVIRKKVVENGITLPGEKAPAYKDDFDIKDTDDVFRTPAPSFAKKSSPKPSAPSFAKKSAPKAEEPKQKVDPIVVPRSPVMKSIIEEEKEEKEAALEQAKEEELARYLVGNDGGVVIDAEEEDTYVVPSLEEYAKEYKENGGETIGANIFKQAQNEAAKSPYETTVDESALYGTAVIGATAASAAGTSTASTSSEGTSTGSTSSFSSMDHSHQLVHSHQPDHLHQLVHSHQPDPSHQLPVLPQVIIMALVIPRLHRRRKLMEAHYLALHLRDLQIMMMNLNRLKHLLIMMMNHPQKAHLLILL